jgi:quercetin dioxygenase-like cupin family protein
MPSISELKEKQLAEGLVGRYVHGEHISFGVVTIKEGSKLPLHHHIHEQITFIIEGKLEMVIGDETHILTSGSYYVIPSNVPHSAMAHTDCKLIDVFNPVREDYKSE